jgi:hypothetical protein
MNAYFYGDMQGTELKEENKGSKLGGLEPSTWNR